MANLKGWGGASPAKMICMNLINGGSITNANPSKTMGGLVIRLGPVDPPPAPWSVILMSHRDHGNYQGIPHGVLPGQGWIFTRFGTGT